MWPIGMVSMPVYPAPGVYLELFLEVPDLLDTPPPPDRGDPPLPGRSRWHAERGTAAFLGATPLGDSPDVVTLTDADEVASAFGQAPDARSPLAAAIRGYFANGGSSCYVVSVGRPGEPLDPAAVAGHGGRHRTGLAALERFDDIAMVCLPELMRLGAPDGNDLDAVVAAQHAAIAHCEEAGNRVALLDAPPEAGPGDALDHRRRLPDSASAALYHPWLRPAAGGPAVPPCGHLAGAFASADRTYGPHRGPVGIPLRDVAEPISTLANHEQALLVPAAVNAIVATRGIVTAQSARALSTEQRWRNLPTRRTMNFLYRNLHAGTNWAIQHRPGERGLWARLARDVEQLLHLAWRGGSLLGTTAGEAYAVRCDAATNPPEIAAGGLTRLVGVASIDGPRSTPFALVWCSAF